MGNLADIVEVSLAQAQQEILSECKAIGLPVDLTWEDGGFPAMAVMIGAYLRSKGSKEAVTLKALTLGELLSGPFLTLWSKSVYGHDRYSAKPAIWQLRVSCASGAGPYTVDEGSMVATDGTLTFRATGDATKYPAIGSRSLPLTVSSGAYQDIAFYCEIDGSDGSSVAPGSINRLVTTFSGVTVTNTTLIQAGSDEETDRELKQRNSTWWATRNKLTLVRDAYIYYARSADSAIKRVALDATNPRGEFTLDVYVAGDSGNPGVGPIQNVANDIKPRLLSFIADRLQIKGVTTVNQTLAGKVYYYSSFSASQVQTAIGTAIAALVKSLPIQGKEFSGFGQHVILRTQYEKAILGATIGGQLCIDQVVLESPSEAVVLNVGEAVTVNSIAYGTGGLELYGVTNVSDVQ